jgi:hypothetical protein
MRGSRPSRGTSRFLLASTALAFASGAFAQAPKAPTSTVTPQFELKRELTDRGATDQRTQTTFRAELLLSSAVSLLRLDVPFVDEKNSFTGDPSDAGLGDLKTRVAFAPIPIWGAPLTLYLDLVFPTGGDLGAGKYQVVPGTSSSIRLLSSDAPALNFLPLAEQYISVGGDPARTSLYYLKLELKVEARWEHWSVSLNPKPVIDWTGPSTASVIDLEGAWIASAHWRLWLKVGRRLWGSTLPSTYDTQVELGVRWTL